MQESNFKNTIVLKNISSNIVEEAIIVLKQNQREWKLEKIEKGNNESVEKPIKREYITKEAEMIVNNYIKKMEEEKKKKEILNSKELKYKKLKRYAYISTAIIIIQLLINVVL